MNSASRLASARLPGQEKGTREGERLAASADRFEGRPRGGTAAEPAGEPDKGLWFWLLAFLPKAIN